MERRKRKQTKRQDGQGLVEYALILVLVAVVVLAILTLLGPQVGNVFSRVVNGLGVVTTDGNGGGGGAPPPSTVEVTGVSASRNGADVFVTITVSANTNITVSDSQSGKFAAMGCDLNCAFTIPAVGAGPGTITVTADGGSSLSGSYPAQN